MASQIYLIRHGETPSNATRVVQTPETPLSKRGRKQAIALGRRLAQQDVTAILSSDLERAHETARAVAAITGAAISLDATLQERNFGDIRGTPYHDLDVDIFAHDYVPPGGEGGSTFERRVADAWAATREAASRTEGILAVVTHGLVLRVLAEKHLETGHQEPSSEWQNTCVTIVDPAPPFLVDRLGCIAHLDEGGREQAGGVA